MRIAAVSMLAVAALVVDATLALAASEPPQLKIISQGGATQVRTDRYVIHSERAGRDFLVEVTHPGPPGIQSEDVPQPPGRKFPAIYALDGGYGFIGPSVRLLTALATMAPAYVISIGYPNDSGSNIGPREIDLIHVHVERKANDARPAGDGGAAFEAFMLQDLRPFLERRYPLDPKQAVLFGHSLGGLFAATILVNKPDAFAGYVIGSPALGNDLSILDKAKAVAPQGGGRRVFITSSPQDLVPSHAREFAAALSGEGSAFIVRHQVFSDLGHGTSYFAIPPRVFPFLLPPTVSAAAEHKTITLSRQQLQRYAGRYQLAPDYFITITEAGGRLFAQATGQPEAEIFAESDTLFFYKIVDAQIRFVKDDAGAISRLSIHQGERDTPASRVE